MKRRAFVETTTAAVAALALGSSGPLFARAGRKPNFIIVLCDDLGYGDIEPTGGRMIPTPNLNRMAREGTVLTDYYAPQNICTASRAGLLTGRYPIRTGLGWGVILQFDPRLLPLTEVTIPKALKPAGYVSGLFGKWHLGHQGPDWQPTKHGFDRFFGIPYSHDMLPLTLITDNSPDVEPTHEPPVLPELQERFYAAAATFIEENAQRPFFCQLALSAPHLPEYPNAKHRDASMQSAYGEVVEEIDSIVGRLMAKLESLGLERDTLIVFTSDNGPWYEGSNGGLRDAPSPHEALYLFNDEEVVAVRTQRWKYVAKSYYHGFLVPLSNDYPQLYDVSADLSESYSVAERNPDVLAMMQTLLANAAEKFKPMKTEIPAAYRNFMPQLTPGERKPD